MYDRLGDMFKQLKGQYNIVAFAPKSSGINNSAMGEAAVDVYIEVVLIKFYEVNKVGDQVIENTRIAM